MARKMLSRSQSSSTRPRRCPSPLRGRNPFSPVFPSTKRFLSSSRLSATLVLTTTADLRQRSTLHAIGIPPGLLLHLCSGVLSDLLLLSGLSNSSVTRSGLLLRLLWPIPRGGRRQDSDLSGSKMK